ncbi:hypothetical protein NQ318_005308 [Aromia moschata]|uniref:DUF4817 domain-containing protein n=1 Tax=Aromia moschata TaxID=1265417 RepID=A0AAV8XVC6_9CUCU|nr:hypothetical protein NQ318_005308 [Aromia moschata]
MSHMHEPPPLLTLHSTLRGSSLAAPSTRLTMPSPHTGSNFTRRWKGGLFEVPSLLVASQQYRPELARLTPCNQQVFVLQFREMVYITEIIKITILQMIGYGDRTGTQAEPISQGAVSKIKKQFRERGHARQLKKNHPNKLSDDQKLDIMLMLEENPHM